MIAKDWMNVKTDKELRVMIKRARYARIITIIGYTFMFVGIGLLVLLPCFGKTVRYVTGDSSKPLPLQTNYYYNTDRSLNYELTFVAQTVMCIMAAASYSGVDNLFGLLMFHLCSQMENLKEKLINMRQYKSFKSGLNFIIKDHTRLIKFCIGFSILILGATYMCIYVYILRIFFIL